MTDLKTMEVNVALDGARGESESFYTTAIPLKEMESLNNASVLR